MGKRIFLTDKEVATVLEVSPDTIRRIAAGFVRGGKDTCKTTKATKTINLKDAKPESIGGFRRWRASILASVLGITVEELEERLR